MLTKSGERNTLLRVMQFRMLHYPYVSTHHFKMCNLQIGKIVLSMVTELLVIIFNFGKFK